MVMRKLLLSFLASLLFLVSFMFIFSISAYSLLYPETYIDGLREAGAFEYFESGLKQVPGASFIKIPQEGVEAVVTPLLSNFLSYLRSESDELSLKVEIDASKLRSFFIDSINKVETCKPLQEYSFDDLDNICRPSNISPDVFLDDLLEATNKSFFASNLSDLSYVYSIEEGSSGRAKLDEIRGYIQYYRLGMFFLAIIFLFLILAFYFVNSRDLAKTMRSVGVPVMLAGLLILISVLLGAGFLEKLISGDSSLQISKEIISYLLASSMRPFYTYSISFFIVGVCLIIGSFLLPEAKEVKGRVK